jgi:4-amino-4-deoxy-L-arabinose transferase-like glycosyltransferase
MKTHRLYLVCVGVLSLLVCAAINLLYLPNATILPDEQRYLKVALQLARTGQFWVDSDRAFEMPGTAAFFALVIELFGKDLAVPVIRTLQSLFLAAQSILIGLTAARLFKDRLAGAAAATIAAFYPFFLYLQGLLLSEPLFNVLLVAAFASLYWWRERGAHLDWLLVLTTFCFAMAAMTKATLAFLPIPLVAVAAFQEPHRFRRAAVAFLAAGVLFSAFMSPWWIRNYAIFQAFVPFSTSAWQNAYLGNNPRNTHAGIDWNTDVEPEVARRIREIPNEVARDRAYRDVTISYIVNDPSAFVDRMSKKFVRFWSLTPNAEGYSSLTHQLISAASFGPILLLALLCAVRHWRDPQPFLPIYLLIGYFTAVSVTVIASVRYRLPLEPFLILLASEPISQILRWLRTQSARP